VLAVGADHVRVADPARVDDGPDASLWSSTWIQSRTFSPVP
jgi:hypothetical protein